MYETKDLIKATFDAGREFFRSPVREIAVATVTRVAPVLIPIRSLGENHRARIGAHLLSLSPRDRYLRFGYTPQDAHIQHYVAGLDFERDEIFGIFNRKLKLLAVAHLAYGREECFDSCAEFGVSVLESVRGRGYGARLFERAAMHAGNDGVRLMFIHALSENSAMLKIARNAGARVERDGSESQAFLQLPKPTMDSRVAEVLEEQMGQADYHIKVQARQFWSVLTCVQKARCDMLEEQKGSRHEP
jgi:GNAT superfamily N-acetyltransferase